MFFLESLSKIEVRYRVSFSAGPTVKKEWGGRDYHKLFQLLGGVNRLHFFKVETYDREMVRDYCVNDMEV